MDYDEAFWATLRIYAVVKVVFFLSEGILWTR